MKFRKSRHFRRQVKFYTLNFGFHEPAQLLLDGNFIKLCVEKQMNISYVRIKFFFYIFFPQQLFTKYSHLKCVPKVTQCVLDELLSLNSMFPGVYSSALNYQLVRCGHFKGVQAQQCLLDMVKAPPSHLPNHQNQYYWIFSQDTDLQHQLNAIDHVPVGYLQTQGNTLTLLEPNDKARKVVMQQTVDKFLPDTHEYKLIAPVKKLEQNKLIAKQILKARKERIELQMKVKKPTFGPNPLASKKKLQPTSILQKICKRRHKIKGRRQRKSNKKQEVIE